MSEFPEYDDNLVVLPDLSQQRRNRDNNSLGFLKGLPAQGEDSLPVYLEAVRDGVFAGHELDADERREFGVSVCKVILMVPCGYDAYRDEVCYIREPVSREVRLIYLCSENGNVDMSHAFFVLSDPVDLQPVLSRYVNDIPRNGSYVGFGSTIKDGIDSLVEAVRKNGFDIKIVLMPIRD